MYTQCPECLTIYKIGVETLTHGRGRARCGHCAAMFDALRTLTEQLPPEPVELLATHPSSEIAPQLSVPALRPKRRPDAHRHEAQRLEPLRQDPARREPAHQETLLFDPDDRMRAQRSPRAPAFARERERSAAANPRNWPWTIGAVALLLGLVAQLGYAKRDLLLDDSRTRPWLDRACAALSCRLPLRHEPGKLVLLSRDIRPHPSVPHALIISATLRNDAAFAQAFPGVEITLSDLDENRIAMRRFQPHEYLGDARTTATGMAPGATTALVFEVADPGKNAVAFEFTFL